MTARKRLVRALVLASASAGTMISGLVLVFALASRAWTISQLAFAGCALLVALATVVLVTSKRLRIAAAAVSILSLGRIVLALAPLPHAEHAGAPLETIFLDGFPAGAPWFAGIPERELSALGSHFMLTENERKEAPLFQETYDAIERESSFRCDESVVPDSFFVDRGHAFLARPKGDGPFPLLVFLHGHGGNFQVYAHWLGPAAARRGIAAVFPTFGSGRWERPEAISRVDAIIDDVSKRVPIDARRIVIAGLSQGCAGAYGSARAKKYAGLVAISGYTPPDGAFGTSRFLVIHGARDERIHVDFARRGTDALRGRGASVDYVEYPEGDHLVLMTRREEVVPRVLDFVDPH